MAFLLDSDIVGFPDPRLADEDGFLAVGGSMEPLWLLNAYYMGIFPWYSIEGEPYWYSLDPRMLLFPKNFRCSKSLSRLRRSNRFEVRVDTCFRQVVEQCAAVQRPGQDKSWISTDFIDAYCKLHEMGFAHSFETFKDGQLVGGLYGVSLCDFFSGESMFHTERDASKVAFARLVDFVSLHGFRFIDAQQPTNHLSTLGAKPVERERFLSLLENNDFNKTYRGRWRNNSAVLLIGGNQGDRVSLLMHAVGEIASRIGIVSVLSPVYETAPWGFEAEQNFLNQALVVDTDMPPHEVLREALAIEADLGRQRTGKGYSSRPMDIDIIYYNNEIIETPDLQIPHPRMHQRRFVLEPLNKIIPDFFHPKFQKTTTRLLEECSDKGAVSCYL